MSKHFIDKRFDKTRGKGGRKDIPLHKFDNPRDAYWTKRANEILINLKKKKKNSK